MYYVLTHWSWIDFKQECILVGCVTSAAAAVSEGGCLPRGVSAKAGGVCQGGVCQGSGGVCRGCLPRGVLPRGESVCPDTLPPPTNRITDGRKTLPLVADDNNGLYHSFVNQYKNHTRFSKQSTSSADSATQGPQDLKLGPGHTWMKQHKVNEINKSNQRATTEEHRKPICRRLLSYLFHIADRQNLETVNLSSSFSLIRQKSIPY